MKAFTVTSTILLLTLASIGCDSNKAVDVQSLKPITMRAVGDLTIVLLDKTGDLTQGKNDFVIQFRDQAGEPVDVGEVQLASSMSMPSMAPMSGGSEVTATGQIGTYRVTSNFGMSGAWHFTINWSGQHGQGKTTFNSNVS